MGEFELPVVTPWLDENAQATLNAAGSASGMSPVSLALYARWWQLETWLRELAYLETRALGLEQWTGYMNQGSKRQRDDSEFAHMLGADSESSLAYFDYSQLLNLIEGRWDLFQNTLISHASWDGRQSDLSPVRHRIAHARRPHRDDLGRIEQTLRDLERGAYIAVSTYNDRGEPAASESGDPIVQGWLHKGHPTARRLIDHAYNQYDTTFMLRESTRPWGTSDEGFDPASPKLWHADFFMGEKSTDLGRLWRNIAETKLAKLAIHVAADRYSIGFVFSDNDDHEEIADAIGTAFDAVLTNRSLASTTSEWDRDAVAASELDFRIKVDSVWNIVDRSTLPITMFNAGGGVNARPRWRDRAS